MRLVLAFLCSAVAFPLMWFSKNSDGTPERWPKMPYSYEWDPDRTWFHNMKDRTTTTIRADVEWWGKCLLFTILVLIVIAALT